MNTITINPGADIQKVINSAASGTTVVFTPGTYNVSNVIDLKSGVSLQGQPGAELLSNGSSGIFQGLGVHDITISGFTFDGHNGGPGQGSGAIYLDSSTGDANGTPSNNVNILNNTFQNWTNSSDLWLWGTQNTYIEGNTLKSGYQGINWATDAGTPALNNLVISGNTITGMQAMAIETAFSSTISNIHIDDNNISNIKDISLSFVEGPTGGNFESGTVWGNHIDGTNSGSTLLELGNYVGPDNITVANNVLSNAQYGMMFSHAGGAAVLDNTFTNVQTPFSEDGGYDGTEWIGGNTVDGVTQNGWSGHGPYGTEPALYSPLNGSSSAPADITTPVVTQVVASPTSGIENVGKTVNLTLDLNEAVTVTGTPTLTLNDGGIATYKSGSGTSALTFSYTVGATDTSTSALAVTAVNLPSGTTVTNAAGTAANLSGAKTTLTGLQVDTTPTPVTQPQPTQPSVSGVVALPSSGIEHLGNTIGLTLHFNEAVTVTGKPTLSLNDGGTAIYSGGSGTNTLTFSETVGASDKSTSALAITGVNLPSGATIKDAAGTAADLSGAATTFSGLQIDPLTLDAPTLSIKNPSLSVAAGGTVDLGISVTAPDSADASVTISGLPRYETITDNLDHKIFHGSSITLSMAEVDSGLTLQSNYQHFGYPVATLTVTAHDSMAGRSASSASQTITVTDPPATSSTTDSFALLSQYLASDFNGNTGQGQITSHSSSVPNDWVLASSRH